MRALLLLLLLAGCTGTPKTICPAIVEYPPERQQQARAELDTLPDDSALGQFMVDYGQLRDRLRACK